MQLENEKQSKKQDGDHCMLMLLCQCLTITGVYMCLIGQCAWPIFSCITKLVHSWKHPDLPNEQTALVLRSIQQAY